MLIALITFLSSVYVPLSLCVRVSMRACVCAVLCVSLATVRRVLCPLLFLSVKVDCCFSASNDPRASFSNTFNGILSFSFVLLLTRDFPDDFPMISNDVRCARLFFVLWCVCVCVCVQRAIMKTARALERAFDQTGLSSSYKKKFKRKERDRRLVNVHDFETSWSGARPIPFLVLFSFFFRFSVSFFFRLRALSYKRRVFNERERERESPKKKNWMFKVQNPVWTKKSYRMRCER